MTIVSPASAVLRLTPRDRALIAALHELRYLTTAQVRQVWFHSASLETTSHRLTLLRRRGLLDRLTHRTFHDRRAFWHLTPLGRSVAAALTGTVPDSPRATALAALQMDHVLGINQIFCDLCTLYRAGRLAPFSWLASRHTRIDLDETFLVPDAVVTVALPDGVWWIYCLELDRSTMPASALETKFERYRLMNRIATHRRSEPLWEARAACWVLFACGDAGRAALAARLACANGLDRLWAGTAAELPDGLAASVGGGPWRRPDAPLPGLPAGIMPPEPDELVEAEGRE